MSKEEGKESAAWVVQQAMHDRHTATKINGFLMFVAISLTSLFTNSNWCCCCCIYSCIIYTIKKSHRETKTWMECDNPSFCKKQFACWESEKSHCQENQMDREQNVLNSFFSNKSFRSPKRLWCLLSSLYSFTYSPKDFIHSSRSNLNFLCVCVWKSNFLNSLSKIFLFLFLQIESESNSPATLLDSR